MCVICAKPSGVAFPSVDYVYDMWTANPDGAGFMWADGKKVHIKKGFMTFNSFKDAYTKTFLERENSEDIAAVLHFRITTHGGTKPENCHPFPVSGNMGMLQKLECTTNLGAAHNGIISGISPRKNCSDTMEYIVSVVSIMKKLNKRFYLDKNFGRIIENTIGGSRFCFLDPAGTITTIGTWQEDDGLLLSNKNFKSKFTSMYKSWGGYYENWYDDDDDEWMRYYERYYTKSGKSKSDSTLSGGAKEVGNNVPKLLPERTDVESGWTYRSVVDLCLVDDAAVVLDGVSYEPYEFYMGNDGTIYCYSDFYDALYPIPGAYAKNEKTGERLEFDFEKAEGFWTITSEIMEG